MNVGHFSEPLSMPFDSSRHPEGHMFREINLIMEIHVSVESG